MRNGPRQNHPVVSLPETSRHAIQRQIEQTGKGIEKKNESGRLRYLSAKAGEAGRKPRCVTWVVVVFLPLLFRWYAYPDAGRKQIQGEDKR